MGAITATCAGIGAIGGAGAAPVTGRGIRARAPAATVGNPIRWSLIGAGGRALTAARASAAGVLRAVIGVRVAAAGTGHVVRGYPVAVTTTPATTAAATTATLARGAGIQTVVASRITLPVLVAVPGIGGCRSGGGTCRGDGLVGSATATAAATAVRGAGRIGTALAAFLAIRRGRA